MLTPVQRYSPYIGSSAWTDQMGKLRALAEEYTHKRNSLYGVHKFTYSDRKMKEEEPFDPAKTREVYKDPGTKWLEEWTKSRKTAVTGGTNTTGSPSVPPRSVDDVVSVPVVNPPATPGGGNTGVGTTPPVTPPDPVLPPDVTDPYDQVQNADALHHAADTARQGLQKARADLTALRDNLSTGLDASKAADAIEATRQQLEATWAASRSIMDTAGAAGLLPGDLVSPTTILKDAAVDATALAATLMTGTSSTTTTGGKGKGNGGGKNAVAANGVDGGVQTLSTTSKSSDPTIAALQSGMQWGDGSGTGVTITYSFHQSGTSSYTGGTASYGAEGFNLTEDAKDSIREALSLWSTVANVTFVEVEDTGTTAGDLRFGATTALPLDTLATGFAPTTQKGGVTTASSGDVWLSQASFGATSSQSVEAGSTNFMTLMTEIGHALGLQTPTSGTLLTDGSTVSADAVAAMQDMYGANTTSRAGNTVYQYGDGAAPQETIWDAGGTDMIDASNQTGDVAISLVAGSTSAIGGGTVTLAAGVTIESAVGGSGNDTLTGNANANYLAGGVGDDILTGGAGDDVLDGGEGTNVATFSGTAADYTITDLGGGLWQVAGADGTDTLANISQLKFADGSTIDLPKAGTPAPKSYSEEDLIGRLDLTIADYQKGEEALGEVMNLADAEAEEGLVEFLNALPDDLQELGYAMADGVAGAEASATLANDIIKGLEQVVGFQTAA